MPDNQGNSKFIVLAPPIISGIFTVLAAGLAFWGNVAREDAEKAKKQAEDAVLSLRVPVGTIVPYAGDLSNPENVRLKEELEAAGWLVCDGGNIPTARQYDKLREYLNNKFGPNRLPDLQGRTPIGAGSYLDTWEALRDGEVVKVEENVERRIGEAPGHSMHMLRESEMPKHSHGLRTKDRIDLVIYSHTELSGAFDVNQGAGHGKQSRIKEVVFADPSGGSQPHDSMQPSLVVYYLIKAR